MLTWYAYQSIAAGAFRKSATGEREKRVSEAPHRAIHVMVLQLVAALRRGDIDP